MSMIKGVYRKIKSCGEVERNSRGVTLACTLECGHVVLRGGSTAGKTAHCPMCTKARDAELTPARKRSRELYEMLKKRAGAPQQETFGFVAEALKALRERVTSLEEALSAVSVQVRALQVTVRAAPVLRETPANGAGVHS